MSIHNKFLEDLKKELDETEEKIKVARVEVNKARAYGDLRENAEYEIARETYLKLHTEKEKILELLQAPVLYSTNSDLIEPGCIIAIKVYGPFKEADANISEASGLREMSFSSTSEDKGKTVSNNELSGYGTPNFKGILLFGGLPDIYDFSVGKTMNVESNIGKFINGKPSGVYNVQVPDGFVVIDVCKLRYYRSPNAEMTDTEYSIKKFFEKAGEDYRQDSNEPFYEVTSM